MTGRALCLLGPTGAGKTGAALALAEAFAGSVVNFDSRQVYRGLGVTTAQPSPDEAARCPHLLYGFLDCSQAMSAGAFAERAEKTLAEVWSAGRLPILVGGTGLYLRALTGGLSAIPATPEALRRQLLEAWNAAEPGAMHAALTEVDPAYAARIHANDRQRVLRALEVFHSTGRPFSAWHADPGRSLVARPLKIGLRLDKTVHEAALERRIDAMLQAGALEEIRQAMASCPGPEAPGLTGIGCAELAACLRGELSLDQAKSLWLKNTKAYAKRQLTWFNKEPGVHWFVPDQVEAITELARDWLTS
ncbi:tRNA (adenosine(37)-N6)-dimethylallyltransferase MiaA [Fundidesulfovibrio butyratiphilus]